MCNGFLNGVISENHLVEPNISVRLEHWTLNINKIKKKQIVC